MNDDLLYKIGITFIPKVGVVIAKNLISYCGSVEAVFMARKKELLKIPGIGPEIAESILDQNVLNLAEQEIVYLAQNDIQPLFYLDNQYPRRLKNYPDAPLLLYHKGNTNLNANRTVAIVGTRKPTYHGVAACEDIVTQLRGYNVVLISGLAYGIDITAHKTCLKLDIPTVGVVGHGLDTIYPASHKDTAMKMLENGGVLSEFPSKTKPDGRHFPMRNRIIAGMADAVIVVETANKGGSMITANIAQ